MHPLPAGTAGYLLEGREVLHGHRQAQQFKLVNRRRVWYVEGKHPPVLAPDGADVQE